jgi:hypothetical protein
MQVITVKKTELLAALNENKSKHREVFEAAVTGFRSDVIAWLELRIDDLKAGKIPNLYTQFPTPEDHTRDYDRIIKMVQMHIGDTFELTEKDFQAYVMDDWTWKRQFVNTSHTYAAAATIANYGSEYLEQ